MIALVLLGIFVAILVVLAFIKPSEPDAITREVIEQGLTGPVRLAPAHTRLPDPNQPGGNDEAP